jgi:hypothetical protein
MSLEQHPAGRGLVEARQHPAKGGLATTRLPYQPYGPSRIDLEIHPVNRFHPLISPPGQEFDQQAVPDGKVLFDSLSFN